MPKITTIKISTEIRERLLRLKEHEKESFNEVINKILYVLNICRKEPEKSKKVLENIDKRIKRREILKRKMRMNVR